MKIPEKWKSNFAPAILSRGLEYYRENRVSRLEYGKDTVTATVQGEYLYTVTIETGKESIQKMSCTCPHAYEGNNCKHMAAVCYAWEHDGVKPKAKKNSLERATEEDLRGFVRKLITENREIREQFDLWMQESVPENEVADYKKEVRELISRCLALLWEYQDDYDHAASIASEPWIDFVHAKIDVLIRRGHQKEAASLIHYGWMLINRKIEEMDRNGVDGGWIFDEFVQSMDITCTNAVVRILENNPKGEVEKEIFNCLCKVVELRTEYGGYSQGNEYPLEILRDYFTPAGYREQLLELMVDLAETRDEVILNCLFQLMDELKSPAEDIKKWEDILQGTHAVALRLSDKSVGKGDYTAAAQILYDYFRKMNDGRSTVFDDDLIPDLRQIIRYTKISGDTKLRKEAYAKILTSPYPFSEDYREYRSLFTPEEWIAERDRVYENACESQKSEMLFSDERYDLLLERLAETGNMGEMSRYEAKLGQLYPEKVAEWHGKQAERFVARGYKNSYKEAVVCLSHALKYEAGKKLAADILAEWKEKYPRRKLLWEEIKKAGLEE